MSAYSEVGGKHDERDLIVSTHVHDNKQSVKPFAAKNLSNAVVHKLATVKVVRHAVSSGVA